MAALAFLSSINQYYAYGNFYFSHYMQCITVEMQENLWVNSVKTSIFLHLRKTISRTTWKASAYHQWVRVPQVGNLWVYNKACMWKRLNATWHFSIILISLRVEVAQISDFLVHAKILPLWKPFFNLSLPQWQERHSSYFLFLTSHDLFWSSISTNCWGSLYFEYFLANVVTV